MEVLKSRLYNIELKKREKDASSARSALGENAWGNQIRTYTLQPYQMVKDARTGAETTNPTSMLNGEGDLDIFLKASLWWSAKM